MGSPRPELNGGLVRKSRYLDSLTPSEVYGTGDCGGSEPVAQTVQCNVESFELVTIERERQLDRVIVG
jgi:hypothetical protein